MKEVVVDKGQRPAIQPNWLKHHVSLEYIFFWIHIQHLIVILSVSENSLNRSNYRRMLGHWLGRSYLVGLCGIAHQKNSSELLKICVKTASNFRPQKSQSQSRKEEEEDKETSSFVDDVSNQEKKITNKIKIKH